MNVWTMQPRFKTVLISIACATAALGAIHPPKPGFNLFSPQQDIQLGREAQAQVERQRPVVHSAETNAYLTMLGQKLARSKYAGNFPFRFSLVVDKTINAFALPGGPVYVHTGLIAAADNEAQLAGVLAHEMSHVALRHSTHQLSEANLIRIPLLLAGALAGNSILGQLTQLGLGLGANSVLLKFSRSAESDADYNGALIMADAGYNPIEMARFFEKLEAKGGRESLLTQFVSDHPNPGNRVKSVEDEIRQMPQRSYGADTGQFAAFKNTALKAPIRNQLRAGSDAASAQPARPSAKFRLYEGASYSLSYPENWQAFGERESPSATFAPREALIQGSNGATQVGYGLIVSYFPVTAGAPDLRRDTAALMRQLEQQNSGMKSREQRDISVDGHPAILTTLSSPSPFRGESEVDALVTAVRRDGLFYVIFIAPRSEWEPAQKVFEEMLRTIRFHETLRPR